MMMEMMDGYCHPVLSQADFLWLVGVYMGDEAEKYLRDILDEADAAIAERDEMQDEIDELNLKIQELEG